MRTALSHNIKMSDWYLYMIRCGDNSLYTGVTTDVDRRFREHSGSAKGAKYTRSRGPLTLVFSAKVGVSRGEAQRIEMKVQKLTKERKETLVSRGSLPAWVLPTNSFSI